jgi:pimeloyl-ACP methyl ester carboxylesterase
VVYESRAQCRVRHPDEECGKLELPVLFLHSAYYYTCQTVTSRLAEPMRQDCADLTEVVVQSGHWMAQERPTAVNAAWVKWLAIKAIEFWPSID